MNDMTSTAKDMDNPAIKPVQARIQVELLKDELDTLWEKHLVLLDQYYQAQQALQQHLSAGFFALTQASLKSPTGRRYGQDYYDDRMQATRRFTSTLDNSGVAVISNESESQKKTGHQTRDQSQAKNDSNEHSGQLPTPPQTPMHTPSDDDVDDQTSHSKPEQNVPANDAQRHSSREQTHDPLRWYGILVPPILRKSQQSFIQAVQGPIVEASNAAQAMRKVGVDIKRLRKDIKRAEKVANTANPD